jgi:hypothetical protein
MSVRAVPGAAAVLILLASATAVTQQNPSPRVLFIGNSLTAANDLPAMVAAMSASSTQRPTLTYETVALPDFGLPEHWEHGGALRAIRRQRWTHVVLQQGPSSLPASRCTLLEYAAKFVTEIRAAGAQPVFYSVWPPRDRLAFFDAVSESYALAAARTGALLAPAGEAWRVAWQRDPKLALYSSDAFHPSKLGSYLAAAVLFQALTGRDSVAPPKWIPEATAKVLHDAATTAIATARKNTPGPSTPSGCR